MGCGWQPRARRIRTLCVGEALAEGFVAGSGLGASIPGAWTRGGSVRQGMGRNRVQETEH